MTKTIKAAAVGLAGVLALSACTSTGASGDDANTISVVAFSVMETANEPVFKAFQDTDEGKDTEFAPSYGASGDQSRAVVSGANADVVHFSLETDVTRLVDEGLVADDWKDNATNGIATSSVVVFVVRKGNPENIQTWDDLVKPGVEVVTPEPGLVGLGSVEHPRGVGPRRRQRRHRGGGREVRLGPARQHPRAARQRPRGDLGVRRG